MFRTLFLLSLVITLLVNLAFLFCAKEKPPDGHLLASGSTLGPLGRLGATFELQQQEQQASSWLTASPAGQRRLFSRSNTADYQEQQLADHGLASGRSPNEFIKTSEASSSVRMGQPDDQTGASSTTKSLVTLESDTMALVSALPPTHQTKRLVSDEEANLRNDASHSSMRTEDTSTRLNSLNKPTSRASASQITREPASMSASASVSVSDPTGSGANKGGQQEQGRKPSDSSTAQKSGRWVSSILKNSSASGVDSGADKFELAASENSGHYSSSTFEASSVLAGRDVDVADRTTSAIEGIDEIGANSEAGNKSRSLRIGVKSSKDHVYISLNEVIVYESRRSVGADISGENSISGWAENQGHLSRSIQRVAPRKGKTKQELRAQEIEQETEDEGDGDGDGEGRGIHVLVINQFEGYVMARRSFDTYLPNEDQELCLFLSGVSDGRILIFAVRDEASFGMPAHSAARRTLRRLGSQQIDRLAWRDSWAFVVRKWTPLETVGGPGVSATGEWRKRARQMRLAEGLARSRRPTEWASPVRLNLEISLLDRPKEGSSTLGLPIQPSLNYTSQMDLNMPEVECWRRSSSIRMRPPQELERRRKFCDKLEGYGRVCDCKHPAQISWDPSSGLNQPGANWQLAGAPIVVIASNRPQYLYRMLSSLLATVGLDRSMVLVFIDGFHEEPLEVSRLFDVRAFQRSPRGRKSARISHHYRSSLRETFEMFPEAEFALVFEEDLDIASDTLIYFNRTVELLRKDKSLYCSSAWNDQGYEHTVAPGQMYKSSSNSSPNSLRGQLMYRIETMPGLGWLLSRDLFKQELEPHWPSDSKQHDWDMWIRTSPIRKGRECIIPDVSRTYHFGSTGTNINAYFQRQYFAKHAFYRGPASANTFDSIDLLEEAAYERQLEELLAKARVIRFPVAHEEDSKNNNNSARKENKSPAQFLCSLAHERLDKSSTGSDDAPQTSADVIFIRMIDGHDFGNWLNLAKCWHIWDLDARGQHKSMWRLFINGRHTLVVGVPASPYSHFKPPDLTPFEM